MKKILIIGVSFDEQKMIERLDPSSGLGPLKVQTTASFGQPKIFWTQNPPDILVLRMPVDNSLETFYFKKIKNDLPPELPMLFISDNISSALMQMANFLKKVRILKTPLDEGGLQKTLQELLVNYPAQQIATRFPTEQPAIIRSELRPGEMSGVIRNLSATGAYIEVEENSLGLELHEIFTVQIEVAESKNYSFDCKVMWTKKTHEGLIGFGVAFINKEELLGSVIKFDKRA